MSVIRFDPSKHPRGNGGRFTETGHADPGSSLLAGWEPDESFPYPQANDLDKVAIAVQAVHAGADTVDAIAHALNLTQRQGGYYANAAGWLGLLEKGDGELDGEVYRVSRIGAEFLQYDDYGRAQFLASIIDQVDDAQETDSNVVELNIVREGLSEPTAQRRAATMRAWRKRTEDVTRFADLIGAGYEATSDRYRDAAQIAAGQRAEMRARAQFREPLRGRVCPSCCQEMPLTGVCDNCD